MSERTTTRLAYSFDEVAQMIGVSRAHMYEMAKQGAFRFVKLGHRSLIPVGEVDALLQRFEPVEDDSQR